MKTRTLRLLAAAPLMLLAACDYPTDPVRLIVPKMTLEATGDSKQLEATIFGSEALPEWESLTPELISVTRAGMVTALAAGEGRVRARIGASVAEGTVTILQPVSVEILSATRSTSPTGNPEITLRLRNTAGRGFYRIDYWQVRETPDGEHRPVLRQMTDTPAPVDMDISAGNGLPGMEQVDWVIVYSRAPDDLSFRTTGCLRMDGGSPCPIP
jgi:hypothetical protein